MTVTEEIARWESREWSARRDALRRGVKIPALAPEVLEARSFLRYWRAVQGRTWREARVSGSERAREGAAA